MLIYILSLLVTAVVASRDPRCFQYKADAEALTLPHRSDCTKFHICDVGGRALEMKCPPNTFFSAKDGVCSFDNSACDGSETIQKPIAPEVDNGNNIPDQPNSLEKACYDMPSGVTLPLVGDCFSYIVCLRGKPIVLLCPEGLAYDSRNSRCEFKDAVSCAVRNPQEPSNPSKPASPYLNEDDKVYQVMPSEEMHGDHPASPVKQPPIIALPEQPFIPQNPPQPIVPLPLPIPILPPQIPIVPEREAPVQLPSDLNNGPAFVPYKEVFVNDPRCLRRSDPNNPILLSYAGDCRKYLVCVGNTAIEKSCPDGQHWSTENGWCDFPSRAKCEMI
ncbi:probable chitinase 10 [Malaya genurostris]|uniref:probable chitinase 10 n=1 Tax=Malaya genurostris TaxID=325434 RepID=UPI0026F3ED49|nr:probable chitinase 10 [Malaya genurostris]